MLTFQTINLILLQILKPNVFLSGKCWEHRVGSTDSQLEVRHIRVSSDLALQVL